MQASQPFAREGKDRKPQPQDAVIDYGTPQQEAFDLSDRLIAFPDSG
jgi:hypothetical protein